MGKFHDNAIIHKEGKGMIIYCVECGKVLRNREDYGPAGHGVYVEACEDETCKAYNEGWADGYEEARDAMDK